MAFPFNGHLSLSVHAKFHLALTAPSQGRVDRGERTNPSVALLVRMLRGSRQDAAAACRGSIPARQTLHSPPSTSPEVCLRSFPSSTHSVMDAAFPSPHILPQTSKCSWHASILKVSKKGALERRGFDVFSLISFL